MTHREYIEYLNHLLLERMLDFDYHCNGSTPDALTTIGDDNA